MEWLNYHHLLYFWTVVREGGVVRAAEKLRLSQPTVSAQVKALEARLGEKLFTRVGRRLGRFLLLAAADQCQRCNEAREPGANGEFHLVISRVVEGGRRCPTSRATRLPI